jgi:hypothetical protein
MTRPGEKPTDIRFLSVPSLGTKPIVLDENSSAAFIEGLRDGGYDGERIPTVGGMYLITITKLGDEDAAL